MKEHLYLSAADVALERFLAQPFELFDLVFLLHETLDHFDTGDPLPRAGPIYPAPARRLPTEAAIAWIDRERAKLDPEPLHAPELPSESPQRAELPVAPPAAPLPRLSTAATSPSSRARGESVTHPPIGVLDSPLRGV